MPSKSSSLLTKTQRRRLRNGFADMDEDKKRRDQQRIRQRLETGVFDFEHLVDYPDRQFELAFEDASDEELTGALANARLVTERIREVRGIERDRVLAAARSRAEDLAGSGTDTRSLERVDVRPASEIERETEERVREELSGNRWRQREDQLLKLVGYTLFPVVLFFLGEVLIGDQDFGDATQFLSVILIVLGSTALTAAMVIKIARGLKHDVVPSLVRLSRDPQGTVRAAWEKL